MGTAMTLEKARELLVVQTSLGGGYNRNTTRLILAEIEREHGQSAVDRLIGECHWRPYSVWRPARP